LIERGENTHMNWQQSKSHVRPDAMEPRRRTVRSSGASGHRIRTVAGIPSVSSTAKRQKSPPYELDSRHSHSEVVTGATDQTENAIAARSTAMTTPDEPSRDLLGMRPDRETASPLPTPATRRVADEAFSRTTYIVAGSVVAALCFVATRPLWQGSPVPAPTVIHESQPSPLDNSMASPSATPVPQREFVALPASQSPKQLGTYEFQEPLPPSHPTMPASDSAAADLARRNTTASDQAAPVVVNNESEWSDPEVPRVAARPGSSARSAEPEASTKSTSPVASPSANAADSSATYPSTDYPSLTPPQGAPSGDRKHVAPPVATGQARLDGNIELLQSDEQ
jgi:hypothetical protein